MFKFENKEYEYIDMSPNQTRVNERRVELPLAIDDCERFKGERILEIGNVLYHYKPRHYYNHDVLDLYEKIPGLPIINEDVLTWKPEKPYDYVVSVSTLEHTGNPLLAVQNILGYTKHCFITIPFGYHRVEEVFNAFPDLKFMRRLNKENDWVEATREEVKDTKYNTPLPFANAIMIIKR